MQSPGPTTGRRSLRLPARPAPSAPSPGSPAPARPRLPGPRPPQAAEQEAHPGTPPPRRGRLPVAGPQPPGSREMPPLIPARPRPPGHPAHSARRSLPAATSPVASPFNHPAPDTLPCPSPLLERKLYKAQSVWSRARLTAGFTLHPQEACDVTESPGRGPQSRERSEPRCPLRPPLPDPTRSRSPAEGGPRFPLPPASLPALSLSPHSQAGTAHPSRPDPPEMHRKTRLDRVPPRPPPPSSGQPLPRPQTPPRSQRSPEGWAQACGWAHPHPGAAPPATAPRRPGQRIALSSGPGG